MSEYVWIDRLWFDASRRGHLYNIIVKVTLPRDLLATYRSSAFLSFCPNVIEPMYVSKCIRGRSIFQSRVRVGVHHSHQNCHFKLLITSVVTISFIYNKQRGLRCMCVYLKPINAGYGSLWLLVADETVSNGDLTKL